MSSGKTVTAIIVVVLAVLGLGYMLFPGFFFSLFAPAAPPQLSFTVKVPSQMVAMETVEVKVSVSHVGGGPAENVKLLMESEAFTLENGAFTLPPGETRDFTVKLKAKDVPEGVYRATFRLKYSGGGKTLYSVGVEREIKVLPAVKLANVGWKVDLFNPFGKSSISRGDSTVLRFQVKSLSQNVIYEGLRAEVKFRIAPEGLTLSPSTIEVEPLGPKGVSKTYSVTVAASSQTPPGEYPVQIQVYAADGTPLKEASTILKLTVTP
ncbi:hypothetical protein DRO53_00260 [Candidatus Bathyarchaeota archaeon]|nr:MAG: hypothetical protein DRO53_00260 [Candidatus Bathyarchaeota archaeon]